jgi:hypothetical protein
MIATNDSSMSINSAAMIATPFSLLVIDRVISYLFINELFSESIAHQY